MELKRALGASIRSLRLKRAVAQEKMGPSQAYISNLEAGKWSASIDKIERIAEALGVHPATIILAGFLSSDDRFSTDELLQRIREELREIGL